MPRFRMTFLPQPRRGEGDRQRLQLRSGRDAVHEKSAKQAYARVKPQESKSAHNSTRPSPLRRRGKVDWVSRLGIGCPSAKPAPALAELSAVTDHERITILWQFLALLDDHGRLRRSGYCPGRAKTAESRATESMERLRRLERSLSWRMTVPLCNLAFLSRQSGKACGGIARWAIALR
jgi:hypothetical protein